MTAALPVAGLARLPVAAAGLARGLAATCSTARLARRAAPLLEPDFDRDDLDLDLELLACHLSSWAVAALGDRLADVLRLLASRAHLFGQLADLLADLLRLLARLLDLLGDAVRPRPVPGIGMPRTFFGLLFSCVPRTTPPTSSGSGGRDAGDDGGLRRAVRARRRAADCSAARRAAARRAAAARSRCARTRSRVRCADDALALGLLRDALALLLRELEALLPFEDVLRVLLRDALLLGLDPFELREVVFLLLCDRELAWAICSSLSRCPRSSRLTPLRAAQNALGTALQPVLVRPGLRGRKPDTGGHGIRKKKRSAPTRRRFPTPRSTPTGRAARRTSRATPRSSSRAIPRPRSAGDLRGRRPRRRPAREALAR